ncbi:MAG: TonB-dependent receptor [Chitinophagaceae bacterium]|nr:TonB-dependent receptor [Oligoflexus sp.]
MKRSIISTISLVLLSSLVTANAQDRESTDTTAPTSAVPASGAATTPNGVTPPSPKATGKEKPEVVSVTGSRIKRKDLDVASPITIVGREEIANTGATTVTEVMKTLPAAVGNSVTTTTTNGGGGGSGNIALRGLDPSSTLVLLNGRRLPNDVNGQSPDLNSIPVGAIERIEVLQDGASAIYGSDAIAGVINIITRKNIDGMDFGMYFGRASKGDLETKNYDLAYGTSNEKGSMVLGLNYYTQGNVKSRDRSVSRQSLHPSSATPNGHVVFSPTNNVIVDPNFHGTNPTPANYVPFTPDARYNYSSITDAIMAQNRKSLFLSGDYELSKDLKLNLESSYTNTVSRWDSAPTPLFTSQETGNIVVSPLNPYNAFGVPLTDVRKRFLELGPREAQSDSDTFRIVAGLSGGFGSEKKWTWDVNANHGEANIRTQNRNIINKTNLMLGLGDPAACREVASLGCVPVNITGPYGSVDAAQASWLRLNAMDTTSTEMNSYTFNTGGELAKLDFATINMAAGAEIRDETYLKKADSNSEKFNTVGNTNGKSTDGDRKIKEVYVEFNMPVSKVVELDLAARYSNYSDFGDTTNPKYGLKITPFQGFTIRGTYSTGFRAPSLPELFGGQVENFTTLTHGDPCSTAGTRGCTAVADPSTNQWLALQGGNPKLQPEKSRSYTFGLAYSLANAWNVKADYWVINTENAIDTNPDFVVQQFRKFGKFADRVDVDANNNITQIRATALNLAARRVKGLDLATDYTLRNTASGTWALNVLASHYINYQNQADASSPFENVVGRYVDASSGGRGSIPAWKGRAAIDWSLIGIDAGVVMNYTSHLNVGTTDDFVYTDLDAWRTYDMHVGYDFQKFGKVTLGIDNLTDKNPPVTDGAFNDNIDARTHNLIGRFYYARYGVTI